MKTQDSEVIPGAKTREQLAQEYNISRRTLYNWLKQAGICRKGKLLTPKELGRIYQKFGHPHVHKEDDRAQIS